MSTADASTGGFELRTEGLTGLHWLAIVLSAITGVIHLFLGISFGPQFFVAGLGFFAGIVAVLVDYRRPQVYLLGIPFTLGQVVLWYYLNFAAGPKTFPADIGTLGAVDKVVQLTFVAVLAFLYGRES